MKIQKNTNKNSVSFKGHASVRGAEPSRLESEHQETLRRYAELLASCVTVRLTGTRGADELYTLHVLDCLESVPYLPEAGQVIDVGSGGGLPGIVWAVCRPDLEVTLLDSVGKKCRAAQSIVDGLELVNVKIICARSEDIARVPSMRESFAFACARAVAKAGAVAELLSPLVAVGGTLLTFKGPRLAEELEEAHNQWQRFGLREPLVRRYGTEGESSRCLVLWEKSAPCPNIFPRSPGMAASKISRSRQLRAK